MTRFLQAAFPNSYLIVITRHTIPVSMAAQKWKMNVTSLYSMFEHWLHCHAIYQRDKKHLKHVYELRYEDYVENQAKYHEEIAAFLGTSVPESPNEDDFRIVTQWPAHPAYAFLSTRWKKRLKIITRSISTAGAIF